jgi:hypothetical protein
MGNATCSVRNDLGEAAEVQSYSGADLIFWNPYATYRLADGEEKIVEAAFDTQGLQIVCNGRSSWVKTGSSIRLSWLAEQGQKLDASPTHACSGKLTSALTETEALSEEQEKQWQSNASLASPTDGETMAAEHEAACQNVVQGLKLELESLQARCTALESQLAQERSQPHAEVALLRRVNHELMKDNEYLHAELLGYKASDESLRPEEACEEQKEPGPDVPCGVFEIGTPRPELATSPRPTEVDDVDIKPQQVVQFSQQRMQYCCVVPSDEDVDCDQLGARLGGERTHAREADVDWYYD